MPKKVTRRRGPLMRSWKQNSFIKFLTVGLLIISFLLVFLSVLSHYFVEAKSILGIDNLAGGLDATLASAVMPSMVVGIILFFIALCLLGFYYKDKTLLASFIRTIITVPIMILTVFVGILFLATLVAPQIQSIFSLGLLISVIILFYVNYLIKRYVESF